MMGSATLIVDWPMLREDLGLPLSVELADVKVTAFGVRFHLLSPAFPERKRVDPVPQLAISAELVGKRFAAAYQQVWMVGGKEFHRSERVCNRLEEGRGS